MGPVESLFRALDAALARAVPPRFGLRIVGSTALFAQTTWRRGTKDSDAVQTWSFDPALKARLLELAGKGTALARHHDIYLEFVGQGILLLPEELIWRPWPALKTSICSSWTRLTPAWPSCPACTGTTGTTSRPWSSEAS